MKRNPSVIQACGLAVLAATFIAASCSGETEPVEKAKPAFVMTPAAAALGEEYEKLRQEILPLFLDRKFDKLEAIADDLRLTREKLGNGAWKITQFYSSFWKDPREPDSSWEPRQEIYKDWIKQFPKSITARVAYAEFMAKYAWKARGDEFARDVTKQGWQLFGERLAKAHTILDESKALDQCPEWWATRIKVAMGECESREECEKIFLQAKTLHPEYYKIDTQYYLYLMPKWHGRPGEWEAVAEK